MEIADAQGNVDGFIGKPPKITAQIARCLLAADRVAETWQTLEAAEHRNYGEVGRTSSGKRC